MRRSVRLRATVLATGIVALALAVAAGVLVWVLKGSLEASADQEARRKLDAVTGLLIRTAGAKPAVAPVPAVPLRPALPATAGGVAEPGVVVEGGRTVQGQGTGVVVVKGDGPQATVAADLDVRVVAATSADWTDGYVTVSGLVPTGAGAVALEARSSLQPVESALAALRPLLFIGVPALLLIVAALTWLLVGQALAPVSAIRAKFTEITASDLHQRVPVPPTRDEVARLAAAMNATLDRLEAAVRQHRRFVADAAHELRSPLATLRTRLELGRRAAPELAGEALTDVRRIQALAADLLLLARLDAGEPLRLEEVDLGQVAAEAAAAASLRAAPRQVRVTLDVAPDVVVAGSRAHLGRVIANLVDNAVRHAASTVAVRVHAPAVLEVVDDGPGIPEADRESVFDRFTRLDEARDRDAGGAGLGLAIARDIVRAHGGTLTVAPASAGACLRAELRPASADGGRLA